MTSLSSFENSRSQIKGAVFISASSSGVGRVCAKILAEKGFWVFTGLRNLDQARSLQQETGGNTTPILLDVTKEDSIISAATQVAEVLSKKNLKLLGIINNACHEFHGPLELLPIEFARQEMEVSYLGYLSVIKAFLPLLRQSRGRIVNFSSINGLIVFPSVGTGCAAKYAVEAMSDAFRMELAPWGIKVSIIEPGAIATPLWQKTQEAFEELPKYVSMETLQLYYPSWSEALKKSRSETNLFYKIATSPEQVAPPILHALTSRNPKIRYRIGLDAKALALINWLLPNWLFDFMARRVFLYR